MERSVNLTWMNHSEIISSVLTPHPPQYRHKLVYARKMWKHYLVRIVAAKYGVT
jgi:hypothetical protein